tara:strand:- start:189 stop:2573 length:2385 start_codon:yes stop_codon:yes gene_type:complete
MATDQSSLTAGFSLAEKFKVEDWQEEAITAWLNAHPVQGPRHGIFDIYTGAGKTVLATEAMARVSQEELKMRFAVVVPTVHLAQQWVEELPEMTDLVASKIGMVGGGKKDTFAACKVIVFVLASARKMKDEQAQLAQTTDGYEVMLVVDECHRAGAASSSKMFDAKTKYRLGLSATPIRVSDDAIDENGLPLPLEAQPHGKALGPVCFRFSLKDGVRRGLLPRFQVHHHGIELSPDDRSKLESMAEQIRNAKNKLLSVGGDPSNYRKHLKPSSNSKSIIQAANAVAVAFYRRKQFLYSASERLRVARRLLIEAWDGEPPSGAILFNERIDDSSDADEEQQEKDLEFGAERLCQQVKQLCDRGELPFDAHGVAIEHSKLSKAERDEAVEGLRSGRVKVLCTVKALQEGINVPDVGMGVSVASTSSARQRIQTMGRILRAQRDSEGQRVPADQAPIKMLHLIYVKNSPDEEIYRRYDWNLETGDDRNYWRGWKFGEEASYEDEPLAPKTVDEDTAWSRIAQLPLPQKWDGPSKGMNLTYAKGTVSPITNRSVSVHNAGEIMPLLDDAEQAQRIRSARGRFTVTPEQNVIIKFAPSDEDPSEQVAWAIGRLDERPAWDTGDASVGDLPGDPDEPGGPGAPASAESESHDFESHVTAAEEMLNEEAASGPGTSDFWYVLLQYAFLGAAEDDPAMIEAAARMLSSRSNKARVAAAKTAANYLAGREEAPPPSETLPATLITEFPQYVAAAFVHNRMDLVRNALREWAPTASGGNDRRVAMLRCMQILTGERRSIHYPAS